MSNPVPISDKRIAVFIRRWSQAESSERANYALFLTELCDVLDVAEILETLETLGRAHRGDEEGMYLR